MLLYEDRSTFPSAVKWLDCRTDLPGPATDTNITHTQQGAADDLCCIDDGKKLLLVVTRSLDGIYAYNIEKDTLAWKVGLVEGLKKKIALESVTTAGCGRVFVGDYANSCIHMFSTNGAHLGFILKEENQTMTQQPRISWCNSVSSLLVAQMTGGQYLISMVQGITPELVDVQNQTMGENARKMTDASVKTQQKGSRQELSKDTTTSNVGEEANMPIFTRESIELLNPSISTKSCNIMYISALPDGDIAVCGKVGEQWRLIQCYLHGGTGLHSTLEEEPSGMTAVTLGRKQCLAVSYK